MSYRIRFAKWYTKYGLFSILMLGPGTVVNYLSIVVVIDIFHFQGWSILAPVTLGDIVGFVINYNMSVFMLTRLKIWMRFIPPKKAHETLLFLEQLEER